VGENRSHTRGCITVVLQVSYFRFQQVSEKGSSARTLKFREPGHQTADHGAGPRVVM
jgi:hypothetical protein